MGENHRLEEAVKAGVKIPEDGYWGNTPSKICGAYAGDFEDSEIKEVVNQYRYKKDKNE